MTPSPPTVEATEPLFVARALMDNRSLRYLPVVESGRLVGMLSACELGRFELRLDAASMKVEDIMSPVAYVVPESALLKWVAGDLARRRIERAVVMRHGRVVGMFTAVEAMRALSDALPELTNALRSPPDIRRH